MICDISSEDIFALNQAGISYETGDGVKPDYAKAFEFYLKAARLGYEISMFNVGRLYLNGTGVACDPKRAAEWFQLSAEHGVAQGYNMLGYIHEKGCGVPVNLEKAFDYCPILGGSKPPALAGGFSRLLLGCGHERLFTWCTQRICNPSPPGVDYEVS